MNLNIIYIMYYCYSVYIWIGIFSNLCPELTHLQKNLVYIHIIGKSFIYGLLGTFYRYLMNSMLGIFFDILNSRILLLWGIVCRNILIHIYRNYRLFSYWGGYLYRFCKVCSIHNSSRGKHRGDNLDLKDLGLGKIRHCIQKRELFWVLK